jgi:protein TonB
LIETAPPVAPPAALEPAPEPIARDLIVRPAPRREAAVRSSERVIGQPRSQRSSATSSAPDPNYYPARALDVYPAPASPLDMPYPARARDARVEGRVELLVSIDEAGTVSEVSVVDAEPAGYFEDVARQTFLGTRFRPGERNGRAVKSRVVIRVSFGSEP